MGNAASGSDAVTEEVSAVRFPVNVLSASSSSLTIRSPFWKPILKLYTLILMSLIISERSMSSLP